MKVKRWIRDGNEEFEKQGFDDTEDILCAAGRLLDDFGTPDTGCTSIEYWDPYNREWSQL